MLSGFGIKIRMRSGQLEIHDGVGTERRSLMLPRVGHGLRRLVCISEDGFLTLSALKWLAGVRVPFVVLDRIGRPLFVSGPTSPSDGRLHYSQSLAIENGTALTICKKLIAAKLLGEETLVREEFKNLETADFIAEQRLKLAAVENLDDVRLIEAHAASAYWNTWHNLPILWPKSEQHKVPKNWLTFGKRTSPLTGSPRLAVTPPSSILNFCFALLESETRLSLVSCGLDPAVGFLHLPRANRDSLALDVMEAVRPEVERWLYRWVSSEPFRRADSMRPTMATVA
jgi:CRISPR-associated protein Cas1